MILCGGGVNYGIMTGKLSACMHTKNSKQENKQIIENKSISKYTGKIPQFLYVPLVIQSIFRNLGFVL